MSTSVLRNTYYSSISIYFEYILGLAISIMVARSLGVDEFGVYSYLVRLAGVCIIFTNAGIGIGAIKFIAEARASGNYQDIPLIHNYFRRVQHFKILLVITLLLIVDFTFPGLVIDDEYRHLIAFVMVVVIFKSAYMYRVGIFKGFERFDYLAFIVLVVSPVNLLAVYVGWLFNLDVFGMYIIFSVVSCLYLFVSVFFLFKIPSLKSAESKVCLDKALQKRISHHLRVVSVNTIVSVLVLGQCEILILKQFASNEAIAFFNVASVLSSAAISLVPGVYSLLLLPIIAKSVAQSDGNPVYKVSESIRYLFMLGVMVAAPSLIYCDQIVSAFYGDEFIEAGWIFGLFTLMGVLTAFRDPINAFLMSADKQSVLLKFSFFSLIVSLSTNYLLISEMGLNGAVLAFCLMSVFLTVVLVFIVRRFLKINPNLKKLALVLLSALVSGFISFESVLLLNGLIKVFIGFFVFGVVYVTTLLFFNALNKEDYDILINLLNKRSKITRTVFLFFINRRIKIFE